MEAGRSGEAMAETVALLPDAIEILGDDHPTTLYIRMRHAHLLYEEGEYGKALDEVVSLTTSNESVFGLEQSHTLNSYMLLENIFRALGMIEQANVLAERMYPYRVLVFGELA